MYSVVYASNPMSQLLDSDSKMKNNQYSRVIKIKSDQT